MLDTGDVYIADTNNNAIRVLSQGNVSTLTGNGTCGTVFGNLSVARLCKPHDIQYWAANNVLIVADDYDVKGIDLINGKRGV